MDGVVSLKAAENAEDAATGETSEVADLVKVPVKESVTPASSRTAAADEEIVVFFGLSAKWWSLITLTLQTSTGILLLKWSKIGGGARPYISSTAVICTEVTKAVTCFCLVAHELGSFAGAMQSVFEHFTSNPRELAKALVPSLLYTVQNNLQFYSIEKLSPAIQQVLYQMKIITTALLTCLLLGRKLTATKWSSLFMLAVGVALVQWPRNQADPLGSIGGDQFKGFVAVFISCFTSGFAAVWIQMMLQASNASLWMRNVQMGVFGSIMGVFLAFAKDGDEIVNNGFFQGFSVITWGVVLMNALGGLLCAVMLKYAGAILGCFGTALSIIITCTASYILFQDFAPDAQFLMGACLAICASLLYGLGLPTQVLQAFGGKLPPNVVGI